MQLKELTIKEWASVAGLFTAITYLGFNIYVLAVASEVSDSVCDECTTAASKMPTARLALEAMNEVVAKHPVQGPWATQLTATMIHYEDAINRDPLNGLFGTKEGATPPPPEYMPKGVSKDKPRVSVSTQLRCRVPLFALLNIDRQFTILSVYSYPIEADESPSKTTQP